MQNCYNIINNCSVSAKYFSDKAQNAAIGGYYQKINTIRINKLEINQNIKSTINAIYIKKESNFIIKITKIRVLQRSMSL